MLNTLHHGDLIEIDDSSPTSHLGKKGLVELGRGNKYFIIPPIVADSRVPVYSSLLQKRRAV